MAATKTRPRYSWEAFTNTTRPATAGEVARRTGVTLRTIERWKKHGIPELQVDHVAIAYDLHPALIWPEQWWANTPQDDD